MLDGRRRWWWWCGAGARAVLGAETGGVEVAAAGWRWLGSAACLLSSDSLGGRTGLAPLRQLDQARKTPLSAAQHQSIEHRASSIEHGSCGWTDRRGHALMCPHASPC